MPATLTQVVKQFQQDWTAQLEPDAILTACHDIGYEWRERCHDRQILVSHVMPYSSTLKQSHRE